MKQLRIGSYTRAEIAEALNVNLADTNHFKRNVEAKLMKWGYSYEYSRKEVKITQIPTTADERLAELLIREYDIDVQIDTYAFSAFLYSIVVFPEFASMPWEERVNWLKEEFEIEVSDRTLRTWCSRLIDSNTIAKDNSYKTRWITGYFNDEKYRMLVDGNKELEESADRYQKDKFRLLDEYSYLDNKEKWETVRKELWNKYHYCVYYCKGLCLLAWDKTSLETMQELIELVNEIAEREPTETIKIVEQHLETTPVFEKIKEEEFVF